MTACCHSPLFPVSSSFCVRLTLSLSLALSRPLFSPSSGRRVIIDAITRGRNKREAGRARERRQWPVVGGLMIGKRCSFDSAPLEPQLSAESGAPSRVFPHARPLRRHLAVSGGIFAQLARIYKCIKNEGRGPSGSAHVVVAAGAVSLWARSASATARISSSAESHLSG